MLTVYRVTKESPDDEKYGSVSRMRWAVVSVLADAETVSRMLYRLIQSISNR
jgi:hypothetical protein